MLPDDFWSTWWRVVRPIPVQSISPPRSPETSSSLSPLVHGAHSDPSDRRPAPGGPHVPHAPPPQQSPFLGIASPPNGLAMFDVSMSLRTKGNENCWPMNPWVSSGVYQFEKKKSPQDPSYASTCIKDGWSSCCSLLLCLFLLLLMHSACEIYIYTVFK